MKITIHRGIDQIGGCITEIATATSKILIDLGHNLPGKDGASADKFAGAEAIAALTEDCGAIFYTHYHGDHVDLFKYVPDSVDQYIGAVAKQVIQCKYEVLGKLPEMTGVDTLAVAKLKSFKTFQAKQKIQIGDITVTPYFVSHSAYDSYMFLIEGDGKRVLHTGDFREHGFLSKGLMKMLDAFIVKKGVDVLITEGTMLSRLDERVMSEDELSRRASELMKGKKYVFALCSSTDIDRLAGFHKAAADNGRSFLCDSYQKDVLDIFTATAGAQSNIYKFDNAFYYNAQKDQQKQLINKKGFCMVIRGKHYEAVKALAATLPEDEILFIYSMWSGYLEDEHRNPDYTKLWDMFQNKVKLHTSGHASAETLAKVCNAVNPRTAIIPIHSECSRDFSRLNISEKLKDKIAYDSCTKNGITILIK